MRKFPHALEKVLQYASHTFLILSVEELICDETEGILKKLIDARRFNFMMLSKKPSMTIVRASGMCESAASTDMAFLTFWADLYQWWRKK